MNKPLLLTATSLCSLLLMSSPMAASQSQASGAQNFNSCVTNNSNRSIYITVTPANEKDSSADMVKSKPFSSGRVCLSTSAAANNKWVVTRVFNVSNNNWLYTWKEFKRTNGNTYTFE